MWIALAIGIFGGFLLGFFTACIFAAIREPSFEMNRVPQQPIVASQNALAVQ
jgi:hypothetical protein